MQGSLSDMDIPKTFNKKTFLNVYHSSYLDRPGSGLKALAFLYANIPFLTTVNETELEGILLVTENILNVIRFTINSPEDFTEFPNFERFRFNSILIVERRLAENAPPTDWNERRARRTEKCFEDIIAARTLCSRQPQDLATIQWQPFFKMLDTFRSDDEKNFMTKLRDLYLRLNNSSANDLFLELLALRDEAKSRAVILSSTNEYTAWRTMFSVIRKGLAKLEEERVILSRRARTGVMDLKTYLLDIVVARVEKLKDAGVPLKKLFGSARKLFVHSVFIQAHYTMETQRDMVSSLLSSSGLLNKLRVTKSVAELIKGNEQENCSICYAWNFTQDNFAILDHCNHFFCVQCIREWFEINGTCPYCRTETEMWTTRDFFRGYKNKEFEEDFIDLVYNKKTIFLSISK